MHIPYVYIMTGRSTIRANCSSSRVVFQLVVMTKVYPEITSLFQSVPPLFDAGSNRARRKFVHRVFHSIPKQFGLALPCEPDGRRGSPETVGEFFANLFDPFLLSARVGLDRGLFTEFSTGFVDNDSSHPRPTSVRASSMNSSTVNVSGRARGSMPATLIAASSHRP